MSNTHTETTTTTKKTKAAKQPSTKVTKKSTAPEQVVVPEKKERKVRETITYWARRGIAEGMNRDELWVLLESKGLSIEKKYYVNWYFAEAKRDGRKTCEDAK